MTYGPFYQQGKYAALETLQPKLLRLLKGPYGEIATRIPVQAGFGALAGTATGSLSDHPGSGAIIGALGGGLGGLAVGSAPKLRELLIKQLTKTV